MQQTPTHTLIHKHTHTDTHSLQAPRSRQHFLAAATKVLLANFTKFWPKCKVCKQCVHAYANPDPKLGELCQARKYFATHTRTYAQPHGCAVGRASFMLVFAYEMSINAWLKWQQIVSVCQSLYCQTSGALLIYEFEFEFDAENQTENQSQVATAVQEFPGAWQPPTTEMKTLKS